jgi:ABC-type antimicrobial peptide transport system permease subunit
MLGIIIGVMSVVVIMSVGAGAQGLILNQIKSLGSNLVGVLPGKSDDKGPPAAVFGVVVTTLTTDDLRAVLSSGNPHITAATAYVRGADTVTASENTTDASFVGVNAQYPNVEDVTIKSGHFFSEDDERGLTRVAVLGSATAKELFPDADPVGKSIKIKKTIFQVIGVVNERGVSGFQNQDNQIFVPVTTAQKLLLGIDHVSFIRFKIDESDNVDSGIEHIKAVLR